MKMEEYLKVMDMTYLEYCDYLQEKYGVGLCDFMTKSFNKNPKVTRTKEGLIAHHKMEDRMILLSTRNVAKDYPFEWQQKENIVYCDYLEHLLLHVLITIFPAEKTYFPKDYVGVGGIITFIAPELNDVYSGWITKQTWRRNCHLRVLNDKDVYLAILKQYIDKKGTSHTLDQLCKSYNAKFGSWSEANNKAIYKEIREL